MAEKGQTKWKILIKRGANAKSKLEVRSWGIVITLPAHTPEIAAYRLIQKHRKWIEIRHAELLEAIKLSEKLETVERSLAELKRLARKLLKQASREVLGMEPCKLVIRKMKTRWASCSPRGTLTLNSLAKYLPEQLIAYIIHHEVCHILEQRHNDEFWQCVSRKYSRYKELEKLLLAYEVKIFLQIQNAILY